MNMDVEIYLQHNVEWSKELTKLRSIVIKFDLNEEFKWKHPCYTFNGNNVLLIHEFKNYCALLFHKGALLKDSDKVLIQQTENVQSARQIRFTNLKDIQTLEPIIEKYILEAIEVEKSGKKIEQKRSVTYDIPIELLDKFKEFPSFKTSFENLTPGRQKGYIYYFSKAKQSKTKIDRIEKNMERIINGKGLNDCICGHSKKMPNCDGSHKYFKYVYGNIILC